ncbi:MAG: hypothetical protein H3C43_00110 [Leptonema sp. (in: Bacteria)]|nr:hypothetical protein [Leptonema sp. (in: bacteria)]
MVAPEVGIDKATFWLELKMPWIGVKFGFATAGFDKPQFWQFNRFFKMSSFVSASLSRGKQLFILETKTINRKGTVTTFFVKPEIVEIYLLMANHLTKK